MLDQSDNLNSSSSRYVPIKKGLSALLSILLPFCLSGYFLGIISFFFLNFGMVLEAHMKLCVAEPDFSGGNFLPKKMGKWTKNGTKTGFFEFIEKFGN